MDFLEHTGLAIINVPRTARGLQLAHGTRLPHYARTPKLPKKKGPRVPAKEASTPRLTHMHQPRRARGNQSR